MTVRIGINPITWTNDDMPELGGDTPLATCLAETREAGFAGTEMGGKFPTTSSELAPLMVRHGLTFISGWYSGKLLSRGVDEEMQAMAPHLTLLAEMGCRVMVFAEGTGGTHGDRAAPAASRTEVPAGEWAAYARKLNVLAERMQARGVQMAFHHHMGTAVQTAAEVDRLMAETGPPVGLLLDTGHALYAGADPLALARKHAGRVVHVHCKDIRRDKLQVALACNMSFLDAIIDGVFTMPGDGCIDFLPILTVLREAGYAGWLVAEAEQDPVKANPLTYAKLGFRNLSELAKKAGFQVQ
jgi:inosose dehydratase